MLELSCLVVNGYGACYASLPNVLDNHTQNPGIDQEENYTREPEAGNERRVPQELQLVSLLKPQSLECISGVARKAYMREDTYLAKDP